MKVCGWKVSHVARETTLRTEIRCHRRSRTVLIPLEEGSPVLNWRDGFGALTPRGMITWMNPRHVDRILTAVMEGAA